jgi:IS5 family transposase
MSLDVDEFAKDIEGGEVMIKISSDHRLLKLVCHLPWDDMFEVILPDLKRTEKKCWWMGRPIRVHIHLGIYILQQMFDLTDHVAEQQVRDNAAFRLFCG